MDLSDYACHAKVGANLDSLREALAAAAKALDTVHDLFAQGRVAEATELLQSTVGVAGGTPVLDAEATDRLTKGIASTANDARVRVGEGLDEDAFVWVNATTGEVLSRWATRPKELRSLNWADVGGFSTWLQTKGLSTQVDDVLPLAVLDHERPSRRFVWADDGERQEWEDRRVCEAGPPTLR